MQSTNDTMCFGLNAQSLVGPTGVQLLDFCCPSVSVLAFLSVEYSSCVISVFNLDL